MLSQEIKSKIQLLWDRLWGGGLSNPITAIENISYLIFMKRLEKFHPAVNTKYKWSKYRSLKGSALKLRVEEVFEFIQNKLSSEDEPFAMEMKKARFGISTPSLLEESVSIIEDIFSLIEIEEDRHQHFQDLLGDVYEYLLKATNEAGKNGQFRTPRHIIQMMVELVAPSIKELDAKICDLTSGSSGFLVGSYQYILKEYSKQKQLDEENHLPKGLDGEKLSRRQRQQLKENTFFGFEIDATMVRIGMMNMMMHGIDKPHITHLNTLSNEYEDFFEKTSLGVLKSKRQSSKSVINKKNLTIQSSWGKNEYSFILANPPFAAKVNSKVISKNLDRVYEINENDKKTQSLQTELLFLERIVYMLKNEGRAAVIVPEGVLFNSGKAYKKLREILLRDCELEAVISLPSGVFNPYTAVKTSILVFTKKQFNSKSFHTKKIWFYGMESDGYTLDNSRKKIRDDYPLPHAIEQYKKRNNRNVQKAGRAQQHFFVDIKEIVENDLELNYNLYKEFVFEDKGYEPPQKLLEDLLTLEEEINESFNVLKMSFNEN